VSPAISESELKHHILDIAKQHGWHAFHLPATNIRGSQGRGYPDLTLCRDGIVMWFELKGEKGKLTAEQQAWGDALPKGTWYVIRPADVGWVQAVLT
jgi:hypothetical protein